MKAIESTTVSENLDAAKIGTMFVTNVTFSWNEAGDKYNEKTLKYDKVPGHWTIQAQLKDKPGRYRSEENMTIRVTEGVGAKLVEVLLPVIVADASNKAQQLADNSKRMLAALGDRAVACIAQSATAMVEPSEQAAEQI